MDMYKGKASRHRSILNKSEFNSQRFQQLELVVLRRQAKRWCSGKAQQLTSPTDAEFSFSFPLFFPRSPGLCM